MCEAAGAHWRAVHDELSPLVDIFRVALEGTIE
jgi:hypothetical protein